jgi:hypothetical protein
MEDNSAYLSSVEDYLRLTTGIFDTSMIRLNYNAMARKNPSLLFLLLISVVL